MAILVKNGVSVGLIPPASDIKYTEEENVKEALDRLGESSGGVTSVNGQTGDVELSAEDIGAIADTEDVVFATDQGTAGTPSISGGGINYSTEEQVVGKWIDGSDVYERTFVGNISGAYTIIDSFPLNQLLVKIDGIVHNGIRQIPVGTLWGYGTGVTDEWNCLVNRGDDGLGVQVGTGFRDGGKYRITVQYIKE